MKKILIFLPARLIAAVINVYQHTLSPDHGLFKALYPHGFCKHYPTCSEYSRQSFLKFGVFKGLFLSVKRLINCHPWTEPKIDLVPNS